MKYQVNGTILQTVEITLAEGESVYTESGGMAWMTPNLEMSTGMKGGLMGALGRAMSGESIFLVDYTCSAGEGKITFASEFPGNVLTFELGENQTLICQKDAFMVAQSSVKLEVHFQKRLGAGIFGGEGFVLQKVTGPGLVCLELHGEITEYELAAGESLKVDPGHVALFHPTVDFDISMVKGIKNILLGGEGLFLADLKGPGKVWLQSMPLSNFAHRLIPFLPKSHS